MGSRLEKQTHTHTHTQKQTHTHTHTHCGKNFNAPEPFSLQDAQPPVRAWHSVEDLKAEVAPDEEKALLLM